MIPPGIAECRNQFIDRQRPKRIPYVRAIDRDGRDPIFFCVENILELHAISWGKLSVVSKKRLETGD
jgi:hypothetical protein